MVKTKKSKSTNSSIKKLCLSREQLEHALRMYQLEYKQDISQLDEAIDTFLEKNDTNMVTILCLIKFIKQASMKLIQNGQLVVTINDEDYPLIFLYSILKSEYESNAEA